MMRLVLGPNVTLSPEVVQGAIRACGGCVPCDDGSGSGSGDDGSGSGSDGDGPPVNCSGLMVPRRISMTIAGYPSVNGQGAGAGGDWQASPYDGMPAAGPSFEPNSLTNTTLSLVYVDALAGWLLDSLAIDPACAPPDYRYGVTRTFPGDGVNVDRYEERIFASWTCPSPSAGGVPRYGRFQVGTIGETYNGPGLGTSPACAPFATYGTSLIFKSQPFQYVGVWDTGSSMIVPQLYSGFAVGLYASGDDIHSGRVGNSSVEYPVAYDTSGVGNDYLWNDYDATGAATGATVRIHW